MRQLFAITETIFQLLFLHEDTTYANEINTNTTTHFRRGLSLQLQLLLQRLPPCSQRSLQHARHRTGTRTIQPFHYQLLVISPPFTSSPTAGWNSETSLNFFRIFLISSNNSSVNRLTHTFRADVPQGSPPSSAEPIVSALSSLRENAAALAGCSWRFTSSSSTFPTLQPPGPDHPRLEGGTQEHLPIIRSATSSAAWR